MTIYTRKGDTGFTDLLGGVRARKDDPRIEAVGEIDELSCAVGLAFGAARDNAHVLITAILEPVRQELFVLGARLAALGGEYPIPEIPTDAIARVERDIDAAGEDLTPLKSFVLPGGCDLAGRLHMARAICRRTERRVIHLLNPTDSRIMHDPIAAKYLNRLGDLLFALARLANHDAEEGDSLYEVTKE